jgi:hypothetical protein
VNILALDLGTNTGWALLDAGRIASGVQCFDVRRGESPGMRFLRLRRWLDEVAPHGARPSLRWPALDLIVYEAPHHRGGAPTMVGVGFATEVLAWCALHDVPHTAVHSGTLKKFATGKGNAGKGSVMKAVRMKGWADHVREELDDNHADALALLHYAQAELLPRGGPQP